MPPTWPAPGASPTEALFALLSELVSKDVLATMRANEDGPTAVIRGRLHRVETMDEGDGFAYLLFGEGFGDTRLVLPLACLHSCGPDEIDSDAALLIYDDAECEIKDVSPEARVARYQRWATNVLAEPSGPARSRQCWLLASMIKREVDTLADPLLVARLNDVVRALLGVDGSVGDDEIPF